MIRVLIFAILPLMALATPRSEVKYGNAAADTGNIDAAQYHFLKALEQGGDTSIVLYNMGNALYDRQEYEKASQLFAGSIDTTKPVEQLENSFYNLGNSFFEAQKFNEAIASYIESLKRNPQDVDAKHNLEMARRMLQQQQQQQQQQKNQEQQDPQQDQQQKEKSENKPEDQPPQDQQQQQQQQQQEDQKPDEEQQEQQSQTAQQMTQEEAERLLNALLQNEQETLEEVRKVQVEGRRPKAKQW